MKTFCTALIMLYLFHLIIITSRFSPLEAEEEQEAEEEAVRQEDEGERTLYFYHTGTKVIFCVCSSLNDVCFWCYRAAGIHGLSRYQTV